MALLDSEINFIEVAGQLSAKLLELYPDALLSSIQWNGTPDFDAKISDLEIGQVNRFADIGLTYEDVLEVIFVATAVQEAMTSRIDHFAKMRQLA